MLPTQQQLGGKDWIYSSHVKVADVRKYVVRSRIFVRWVFSSIGKCNLIPIGDLY